MANEQALYRVFVRNWWRYETSSFSGQRRLVPNPGARKSTIARHVTIDEALSICERYNATHKPGKLSRKAEFTRED